MEVMTLHDWFDPDIKGVAWEGPASQVREIVLQENNLKGSVLLNKEDVVALAKEFGLVVYPKGADL